MNPVTEVTLNDLRRQLFITASIALAVLLFDLMSKQLAAVMLANSGVASQSLLGFHFFLTHNEGTAGGFWLGDSTRLINIVSMSVSIAIAALVWKSLSAIHKLAPVALGLIIGAGLGNTASLLMSSSVVDFIAYNFGGNVIIFNIADVAALCGIVSLAPVAMSLVRVIRVQGEIGGMRTTRVAPTVQRRSPVFEREVPLVVASEKSVVVEGTLGERKVIIDQPRSHDSEMRAD